MVRFRITYARTEPLRYTGNLDMQKVWERYLRRARVPVAYSQGFHPQAKVQQACPLPLGFLAENEIVDVWIDSDEMTADSLCEAFDAFKQPGIEIREVQTVELRQPALTTRVQYANYRVVLFDAVDPQRIREHIRELFASASILRERRGKKYDLRPLVAELALEAEQDTVLSMRLSARDSATGRPEEVLAQIGLDPHAARYIRTGLVVDQN
jgi:radical SAM-linked protein